MQTTGIDVTYVTYLQMLLIPVHVVNITLELGSKGVISLTIINIFSSTSGSLHSVGQSEVSQINYLLTKYRIDILFNCLDFFIIYILFYLFKASKCWAFKFYRKVFWQDDLYIINMDHMGCLSL